VPQIVCRAVEARLYVIPASHPSITAQLMLERKGIAYKRTDLLPVISKGVLRAVGFPGNTVPALRIDGQRLQGSREIARALDRMRPEPPLLPADPERRAAVETAERFGDEQLQHPVRQILWWAIKKDKAPLRSYSEGARIGVPIDVAMLTAAPIIALSARFNEAGDENVRRDLAALPALLDQVDEWIAAGVLGGEELNAADFQIATSIGLALTMDDLRPAIESRPAGELAKRVVPNYPGRTPPILPPEWLEGLHGRPAAASG
jgi:glutathione S-transferase